MNLSALRHADQGSWILQLVASLPKRVHCHLGTIFAFGMPNAFADLKLDRKYTVVKFAGWMVVLVGGDRR
jgi:hypothetical protein